MTPFSATDIFHYSANHYQEPWWPGIDKFYFYKESDYGDGKDPWWWNHKFLNKTVRFYHSVLDYVKIDIFKHYLFAHRNWDKHISPSFAEAFCRIFHNIMTFITPWYKIRRRFICIWYNANASKLLDDGLDFGYIRTRDNPETAYYELKFNGFHYKLTKSIFRDTDGKSVNTFLTGICIAFSNKDYEEKKAEAEAIKEEKTTICTGWIFTYKQAAKELNKIVKLTPELHWDNDADSAG